MGGGLPADCGGKNIGFSTFLMQFGKVQSKCIAHMVDHQWDNKKYMNMKHLEAALEDASIAG